MSEKEEHEPRMNKIARDFVRRELRKAIISTKYEQPGIHVGPVEDIDYKNTCYVELVGRGGVDLNPILESITDKYFEIKEARESL